MSTQKRRRSFVLENRRGEKNAAGILYDEGNVQVTWRSDIGHTAEQYASIATLLGMFDVCCTLIVEPDLREIGPIGHDPDAFYG